MKLKSFLKYMRRNSILEVFVFDEKTQRIGKKFVYDRGKNEQKLKKYKDYYIMSFKAFEDCKPSLTFLICKNYEDVKKDSIWLMF